jgi:hypothetical protein
MTRTTNARIAGFTFLFYIANALVLLYLFSRITHGAEGTAATLAALAGHPTSVRVIAVLALLTFFDAVVLAVALYALTRDQDPDLAAVALSCRVGEGVLAAVGAVRMLGILSVATASDTGAAITLGASLLQEDAASTIVGATLFAVGSTIFAYLFLRARSIPTWLAWLGVVGSGLCVVGLPLELAGFLRGTVTSLMWIPVGVFEVVLGFWLLIKGVSAPTPR